MATTQPEISKLVTRLMTLPSRDLTLDGVTGKDIRQELGECLRKAARSGDHAYRAVARMMDQCRFRPVPAEIREICDQTPIARPGEPEKPRCRVCGGDGWTTTWNLVTYRGNSYIVAANENLPDIKDQAQANSFAEKLGLNQTVHSCAIPCGCLSPTHKVFTEGR